MRRTLLLLLLFSAPLAAQAKAVAIEGGTVHTMVLGQEPSIQDVLIVDGRVAAVGVDLEYPAGCERVSAAGFHVIPALIDGQVHFDAQHDLLYTANGIGLIRDVGGEHVWLLRARDNPERSASLAPSMITSGKLIDIDSKLSSASALIASPEEAERTIGILSEAGVDFINTSHRLAPELRAKVIELAHKAGLKVWSAIGEDQTLDDALNEGLDGILELNSVRPRAANWQIVLPPAFLAPARKLVEANVPVIPMFMANQVILEDQSKNPASEQFMRLMSPIYESRWMTDLQIRLARFGSDQEMYAGGKLILGKQLKLLKQLHDKGVRLVPGSGSPSPWLFPGIALHQEMAFWAKAGIPDGEVLAAATRVAAEAFGVQQDFGTIQEGRYGSLMILLEDPTASISALRAPQMIVCRGTVLELDDIDAMFKEVLRRENHSREMLAKRIEVPQPRLPEDAKLLLEGRTNTQSMGLPLSSEHFRVGRLPDGALVFSANIGFPKRDDQKERRTEVYQVLKDGALEEVRVAVHLEGLPPLIMEGKWVAGSWRMQRTQGGQPAAPLVTDTRQPQVLEVGSITSLLVLGQLDLGKEKNILVVTFLENLEPAMINWRMVLDNVGNHVVKTHQGMTMFQFDENGAVLQARRRIGSEAVDLVLETSDAFGGEGLLLPADKQIEIERRLAAAQQAYDAELAKRAAAKAQALQDEPSVPDAQPMPAPVED